MILFQGSLHPGESPSSTVTYVDLWWAQQPGAV